MRKLSLFASILCLSFSTFAQSTKATIYFYRLEEAPPMDGRKPKVNFDGKLLASMPEETWFAIQVEPGKHIIKMRQKQSELEFDAKPGEVYYVQVSQIPAFITFNQTTRLIDAQTGGPWISKLKQIEVKHLKKRTDLEFVTAHP
jgi:hypothetical protein